MTESMWVELIRVLPTFLWLGFAVAALVIAQRVLTRESHRMTRVETPFVSVSLAQEAMEQAQIRGAEHPDAAPQPSREYPSDRHLAPSVPRPQAPVSWDAEERTGGWDYEPALPQGKPTAPVPALHGTQTSTETADPETEVEESDQDTEPSVPYEPRPPETPQIPSQHGGPGSAPYGPHSAPQPDSKPSLPSNASYWPPASPPIRTATPDAQRERGLRAATRLALSTDLLRGGAIMWVDDHHEWNESLVRLFRTAGIRVDTVATTDEAMRAMSVAPYDLVVTDMRRDNESAGDSAGMDLLDRMVRDGIPTPAIFFSSHPNASAAIHPRAVTATNSPEDLVNYVIDIVGHRRNKAGEGKLVQLPWTRR
ncbi:DNA-binding transcriptional response regulator [Glycomyces tarimensis]